MTKPNPAMQAANIMNIAIQSVIHAETQLDSVKRFSGIGPRTKIIEILDSAKQLLTIAKEMAIEDAGGFLSLSNRAMSFSAPREDVPGQPDR